MSDSMMMTSDAAQTPEDAAQKKAAQAFATKASQAMAAEAFDEDGGVDAVVCTRERVVQLLDRFYIRRAAG